jgi:hypothetical protein
MAVYSIMKWIKAASASPRGRFIGVIYLSYFLLAILAEVLGQHHLSVFSNAINLLSYILYLTLAFLFYFLFRPVNKLLSLIAAIVSAAGCAIGTIGIFDPATHLISPLWFFGPYCLLIGYLIFRSTFLPRILGVLMALAGVGWLIYLSPLEKYSVLYIEIIGILAEASLMLWLIVKGVNRLKWEEAIRIMPGST